MEVRSLAIVSLAVICLLITTIPSTMFFAAQAISSKPSFTADETGTKVIHTSDGHKIVKRLSLHVSGKYECITPEVDGIAVKFLRPSLTGSLVISTVGGGLGTAFLPLSDLRMHMLDSQTIRVVGTYSSDPGSIVVGHIHLSSPVDCSSGTYTGSGDPNRLKAVFSEEQYFVTRSTIESTLNL
jgi:hypothetical protein